MLGCDFFFKHYANLALAKSENFQRSLLFIHFKSLWRTDSKKYQRYFFLIMQLNCGVLYL